MQTHTPTYRDYIKVANSLHGDPWFDENLGKRLIRVFKPSGESLDFPDGVIAIVNYMAAQGHEPAVCVQTEILAAAKAFFAEDAGERQRFYPTVNAIPYKTGSTTPAPADAPRPRGRPRKNPQPAPAPVPADAPRPRGRPRKNPQPAPADAPAAPRPRGRPRKNPVTSPGTPVSAPVPADAPRPRGRPRKNPQPAPAPVPADAPRPRGRPRKNPQPVVFKATQQGEVLSLKHVLQACTSASAVYVTVTCILNTVRELLERTDRGPDRNARIKQVDDLMDSVSHEIETVPSRN